MAQHKLDLLHQINKLRDYLEDHFDEVSEIKAQKARYKINEAWTEIERRTSHGHK